MPFAIFNERLCITTCYLKYCPSTIVCVGNLFFCYHMLGFPYVFPFTYYVYYYLKKKTKQKRMNILLDSIRVTIYLYLNFSLSCIFCRINRFLFGINSSFSFKFVNVLLHSVSSVLFTRICTNIVGFKIKFALIAGILFAIHPIHTEAVCGIVGRAEILACMFFSLSLLFYHG